MAVILALHGVSNRNEEAFAGAVRRLAEGLGRPFGTEVRPVFWGDLGPEPVERLLSVPAGDEGPVLPGTREGPEVGPPVDPAQAKQLADDTVAALAARTGAPVPLETAGQIHLALEEAAARGASLALQADLADALAEALAAAEPSGQPEVRMRGVGQGVGQLVGRLVDTFDREAGRLLGQLLQKAMRGAEGGLSRSIATTVGDVLTYERDAEVAGAIRGRLDRAAAEARAEGHEVHLVAHSLGGLIATEWLLGAPATGEGAGSPVADRRLATLVTFGTQVSLFSELHGLLGAGPRIFSPGEVLPVAVGRWVNVWHQLDPLAFVLGRVVSTGASPDQAVAVADFRLGLAGVPTSGSDLGFHSSYWSDPRFLTWLRTVFDQP